MNQPSDRPIYDPAVHVQQSPVEIENRLTALETKVATLPDGERISALETIVNGLPDAERVKALEATSKTNKWWLTLLIAVFTGAAIALSTLARVFAVLTS